jgi:polysaccharide biosynthesis transport protein
MPIDRFELEKYTPRDEPHALDRSEIPPSLDRAGYHHEVPLTDASALLREYWRRIYKHKWLILAIALMVSSVVAIEAFRTKSIYQAAATIEIGADTRTLRTGDVSIDTEDNEYWTVRLTMQSKIRVLQSRPLLEQVAVQMKLDQNPAFYDVVQRKSVLESIGTIFSRLRHPTGDRSQPRVAEPPSAEAVPQGPASLTAVDHQRLAPIVGVLASNVSAEPIENSRLLTVAYIHSDPSLAAEIVNTVADVFINQSFISKTRRLNNTSAWLSARTRELKAKVEQSEQELNQYTGSHGIFSSDGKDNLSIGKMSSLYADASKTEMDRIMKESLYTEIKAGRLPQLPEAFADAATNGLRARLGEIALKEAEYRGKYGPSNPNVVELQKQKAAIEKQIDESRGSLEKRLKADLDRAVRDEATVKAALARAKADAVNQNQSNIQFAVLSQQVEIAKRLYNEFLLKTNQNDIQVAEQGNNMLLIEPAIVPTAPVGPQRLRTILIAFLLSLAGGIGVALGLEYLNNTIKNVDDVGRFIGVPTLAIIPAITSRTLSAEAKRGQKNGFIPSQKGIASVRAGMTDMLVLNNHSSFAEAYRGLRTSVLLSSAGGPPKTILVTSSRPGEGKTTTTINTGISLSHLGGSVLVIDADMRRPSTHKAFGLDNHQGLSTFLSRDIELKELIRPLPIPNLFLLSSGPVPPNPAELISSAKMRDLIRFVGERYDHVLIDSPPMVNVTDPLILSTLVDGVVLVVEGGKTTRNIVRRARIELATVGARVFGVLLNNVNLKREGYDDYYYHRYHSYYYGSSENAEQAPREEGKKPGMRA